MKQRNLICLVLVWQSGVITGGGNRGESRGHRRNQRIHSNRKSQKNPYHHTAYGKLITSQNLFKTQKRKSNN